MNSFWQIFLLEWRSIVRSKTLPMLLVAALGWMFAVPLIFCADGTADGERLMTVKYSLGGVTALLSVALMAGAAGAFAAERSAKRLQLALVRPVGRAVMVLGKVVAEVALGALVLASAAAVEYCRNDLSRPCRHVLRPVLPSPREEAEILYPRYMADPETPEAVKKAPKATVMRLLVQRACDRYQTVATNEVGRWKFSIPDSIGQRPRSVRLRFTNMYDIRDEAMGVISIDGWAGSVSNITQAINEIPLYRVGFPFDEREVVEFRNDGANSLMLRPRKDIELLVLADGFGWNLLRAYFELLSVLTLLIAFAAFLGASLSRPVALFTAFVVLVLGEMTPSVVAQYPDELETDRVDAAALAVARFAAVATRPFTSLTPLDALAADECIEWRELLRAVLADMLIFPLLLVFVSAAILPRKRE